MLCPLSRAGYHEDRVWGFTSKYHIVQGNCDLDLQWIALKINRGHLDPEMNVCPKFGKPRSTLWQVIIWTRFFLPTDMSKAIYPGLRWKGGSIKMKLGSCPGTTRQAHIILTYPNETFIWHIYSWWRTIVQIYIEIHPKLLELSSGQKVYFKCDLDLGPTWKNVSNGTSTHDRVQLCEIILKFIPNCRSYGPDEFGWMDGHTHRRMQVTTMFRSPQAGPIKSFNCKLSYVTCMR